MILTIHVKPNARKTELVGWRDEGTMIVAIHAEPKDGEANRELIAFLAKHFKVAKSLVEIKHGHSGRVKIVEIGIRGKG